MQLSKPVVISAKALLKLVYLCSIKLGLLFEVFGVQSLESIIPSMLI